MTYSISNQIQIRHTEDEWDYFFTTDEYGTVSVEGDNGLGIHIPKDCIQNFIRVLEQLK